MARPIWSGSVSFGLVNVPVRLYPAVREHKLQFHLVHEPDSGPIGYQKICKAEEKPVPDGEIERGAEHEGAKANEEVVVVAEASRGGVVEQRGGVMADIRLKGKKVAIIATDMVEQVELVEPRKALDEAGAETELISIKPGTIQGFNHFAEADKHEVDRTVEEVDAGDYDALMIPGGVGNPDLMRMDENMVQFVRDFFEQGKPIAVICHGPWMLVEAGIVNGRRVTSWPSLQTDIYNAGGDWVDKEVVVDEGLVTSRKPDDIPAFNAKMIEEFAEGSHARQRGKASAAG